MDRIVSLMTNRHRPASSPPSPEDVFLAWLMALPLDADIVVAARIEIERLDRAGPLSSGLARLKSLMEQAVATAADPGLLLS